ncbi:MAG: hypothetical protein J6A59_15920 [Lachnospiraceae bacterium]|nr:hypothetical protein [Lachnospiraceae bacterium]
MELKNVLKTIGGGTCIQIFAEGKSIFYGCMCEVLQADFENLIEKYSENKVYRINYNKDNGAITLAC